MRRAGCTERIRDDFRLNSSKLVTERQHIIEGNLPSRVTTTAAHIWLIANNLSCIKRFQYPIALVELWYGYLTIGILRPHWGLAI